MLQLEVLDRAAVQPELQEPVVDEMVLVASANAASNSVTAPGRTSSTACSVTRCSRDRAGPRNELEIVSPDDGAVLADEADGDWG